MKVNTLDHIFGQEWEISPAGGATGEAFVAQADKKKLFLKRNSSPFLAVLSAEGIVPKLIWTKRLENGDVITAQEWLEGRELKPLEMSHERVAKLLRKIHNSAPLLSMLERMGKKTVLPKHLLDTLEEKLDEDLYNRPIIKDLLPFLYKEVPNITCEHPVVCHCDINHNNWLLSESNKLYLIDWDEAIIGDRAIDLGMMLYTYIDVENWEDWMEVYGVKLTDHLKLRMKWYVIIQTIMSIQWHKDKKRFEEMENLIQFLEKKFSP